jgi:PAS domain S-box-containing protein
MSESHTADAQVSTSQVWEPAIQSSPEQFHKILSDRERYRALFEMGPVAVYSCDLGGVIDNFNARAAELWGRTPVPGDTDQRFCGSYKLFLPDGTYMPHDESPMAQVVAGKLRGVRDQEVIIERPDGSRVAVIVNIRPLMNQQGELVGAINCFFDISDRKRLEQGLLESHANLERTVEQRTAALRELSSRLMHLQDEERRRISRELHDGVGQYLVHLKMGLQRLARDHAGDSEVLADLIDTADRCVAETRTLSYLLHPPLLDEVGLSSAVNWYVRGFAERSGAQVKLDVAEGLPRLPGGLEILLFRILQESLTNIHRHAESASVDVKLERRSDELSLQVTDYGKGFPPGALERFRSGIGGGVGLRGMRERVTEAGGKFEIDSGANGTSIRASVPLATARSACA